jgi:RND family efflux transporter MFP subunit
MQAWLSGALVLPLLLCGAPAPAAASPGLDDAANCLVRPRQTVNLGSPVFGLLTTLFVDRGARVRQGQILARLDTSVEEAQTALDRARAANTTAIEAARTNLVWNQRELGRRQRIAGNMFSRANELDEAMTKVEQDRIAIRRAETEQQIAMLEAERSQRALEQKIIRSPVDGVVTELRLSPGEFIYQQTPILVIAQIDPLHVDLVLPASRYRSVQVGAEAQLLLDEPVGGSVVAVVDAVDPLIDAASDTFRVRLVVPNPDNGILAGIRCAVQFPEPAASR